MDWSADYRLYSKNRIAPKALFEAVREEIREEGEDVVCALDDTRLRKTGKKTFGVKYTRDPLGPPFHVNFIPAQRFIQISMAAREEKGSVRMIPIDWKHAPTPKKPREKDGEEAMNTYHEESRKNRLGVVAAKMVTAMKEDLASREKKCGGLWLVVDGGYTNRSFLAGIPDETVVVGRVRRDAKLHYPVQTQKEKGRKKVYGEKAPTPEALRQDETVPWKKVRVRIGDKEREVSYKRLVNLKWRPAGQNKTIQLLVLRPMPYKLTKNGPINRRQPSYLICTDPKADPKTIIQRYIWRWDIEVNFRDEKTLLGVGEAQVRSAESVENTTALGVASYAALLAAAHHCGQELKKENRVDTPKWQTRKPQRPTTMNLIQNLRMEMLAQSIPFSGFALGHRENTKPEKWMPHMLSAMKHASSYS